MPNIASASFFSYSSPSQTQKLLPNKLKKKNLSTRSALLVSHQFPSLFNAFLLQLSSGIHLKENVNIINMMDSGDVRHDRVTASASGYSINTAGVHKENAAAALLDARLAAYAGDEVNLNSVKSLEPHDGMEFESKEEAFSFYKEYAKSVGFTAIIKASRRSRISGKFIDVKFVCTRYGNDRESIGMDTPEPVPTADIATTIPVKKKRGRVNRSWLKTDCKAGMHVKRREDGRWVVRCFIKEHNHDIFPDQAYLPRGHRNLGPGNSNVHTMHAIPGRTKKMYVSMSRQSGGHKKLENHKGSETNRLSSCQILGLEEGDVKVLLDHFLYMQDENPNFFYAIDLNEEQRLRNVFWVDAKGRLDYGYFNDVVFLDTTYIKNEYKLPFVPFVGVNHHLQYLLLGCALVAEETKLTYIWLMRAWLRAMGGRAPKVILTDHHKALKEAVIEAFPDSRHCFCLWHILSKIPEKLSYVTGQHENFKTKFDECIFKSYKDEQFEKKWWELVDRFNLRNDIWFQSLYEDRQQWVPTYMRGIFLAGISTVQRSDSLSGVQSIPSQHILKRWTKDAKNRQTTGKHSDVLASRMHRYNDLCRRAFKLGDEGSLSHESYNVVLNALEEALRKCESVNYSIQSVTGPKLAQIQSPHNFEEVNQIKSTTKAVNKINTSHKRQGYPETEISNSGMPDSWQEMGQSNTQESINRMERMNSRTPALDSYFGAQHLVQGMGQLNSIAPPHEAHYTTQQRMHGMGQLHFRPQTIPSCYDIQDGLQDMDQLNVGSPQLHGMASKQLHSKHISG
ncbi:protein FAR-RED ELONGATED HYPOCOTYL 3 isoform X2 [Durio zibethinus]|uniref:Protein FAR1-RELATED SEQUENCE n=1 Tax=Durio zibethinus TaxID=66656 RepID=A0A6P6ACS7_DURZI|nr:protein FAR-RED ELONGATED HYPOCOTYL 3 isoform X2 [Durio zibethinus]